MSINTAYQPGREQEMVGVVSPSSLVNAELIDTKTTSIQTHNSSVFNTSGEQIEQTPISPDQAMFDSHYREFKSYLDLKIRNELTGQLVQSYADESRESGFINLTAVGETLTYALEQELRRHNEQAHYIQHTALPGALRQPGTNAKTVNNNPSLYSVSDAASLQVRLSSHISMREYLSHAMPTSKEDATQLAEFAVKRLLPDVREDVVILLMQQKSALEQAKNNAQQRITELEHTIEALSTNVDLLTAEVVDRDIALLDQELVAHLTAEAQQLASDYSPSLQE